jgi:CDP-diacylglycerol pyrophosphatase
MRLTRNFTPACLNRRSATPTLVACLLAGCVGIELLPPSPVHPQGQALWRIVHDQCVPAQRAHGNPAPCAVVELSEGEARGYVVLKDRDGVAQFLLMPTAKITGIEDPAVLAEDAPNYFAEAWEERRFVSERLGQPLDRTRLSVAVNSIYGRSQDQLHLHIDCVDRSVADALRRAPPPPASWTEQKIMLKGHAYSVRWLDARRLTQTNPFKLVAETFPKARGAMGAWTLALVGARTPSGADGFYVLADRARPASSDRASAEELQDHSCR